MFDGSGGVDADGELFVGEEFGEEGEEAGAIEVAALDEGECAGAAEVARRVGGASPDGFELNVAHAPEEELVLLVFERGEGFGDGVLGQHCGSVLMGLSRKRAKAVARSGMSSVRERSAVSFAAFETR